MRIKLVDRSDKLITGKVGRKSDKGFNTTKTTPKPHLERRCNIGIFKDSVNVRRINAEPQRIRMAKAKFIPFPRLVVSPTERLVALTTQHNHNA